MIIDASFFIYEINYVLQIDYILAYHASNATYI